LAFAITLPQGEIDSYASIYDYQNGMAVMHEITEYLNERSENEVGWLEALAKSEIPTTLIWGELDAIAPVAVPDHVWTSYLENRGASADYWRVPCADHYLQVDESGLVADILRATLAEDPPPAEIGGQACRAVQIETNQ
jgi:pimeloyl-ACP methyl ester carboxylesterase